MARRRVGMLLFVKDAGDRYYVFCMKCWRKERNAHLRRMAAEPWNGAWPIYPDQLGPFHQSCNMRSCENELKDFGFNTNLFPDNGVQGLPTPREITNAR